LYWLGSGQAAEVALRAAVWKASSSAGMSGPVGW
jgi:hypothetical protein